MHLTALSTSPKTIKEMHDCLPSPRCSSSEEERGPMRTSEHCRNSVREAWRSRVAAASAFLSDCDHNVMSVEG